MTQTRIPSITTYLLLSVLMLPGMSSASGDGKRAPLDPTYVTECGSCHVAFPPRLLGPESWHAIVGGLEKHFKVDAGLDEATQKTIGDYLASNARRSSSRDSSAAPLRISESRWFINEHDDISAAVWSKVKSKANCEACHTKAQQGSYSERDIHLPRP